MERSGHLQPDVNAVSFWADQSHVPGTAKNQHHQHPAVFNHQAPCVSPPPSHQQQASPASLQALATVYKMMLQQHQISRIIASINGTAAAWDAIYNDRFAEEDARLKAECQRLLGLQNNTAGSHSSPASPIQPSERSSSDLLQTGRGRRPHPVDQKCTVSQQQGSSSGEVSAHTQPQHNTPCDVTVKAEIPAQAVSEQTSVDSPSITLNSCDAFIGGSQLESATRSVDLCSESAMPFTTIRCDNNIPGGARRTMKTTRSHRRRLRPNTRWKIATSDSPSSSLCFFAALSRQVSASTRPVEVSTNTPWGLLSVLTGPVSTRSSNHHQQYRQHLHFADHLTESHQRYIHHVDLH